MPTPFTGRHKNEWRNSLDSLTTVKCAIFTPRILRLKMIKTLQPEIVTTIKTRYYKRESFGDVTLSGTRTSNNVSPIKRRSIENMAQICATPEITEKCLGRIERMALSGFEFKAHYILQMHLVPYFAQTTARLGHTREGILFE